MNRFAVHFPFAAAAMLAANAPAQVANPSFETGSPLVSRFGIGQWGYDGCSFVTAERGITPAAGRRMLRADATSGSGAGGLVCDVYQIVDLTAPAYQSTILAGGASANVSVLVNRIAQTTTPSVDTLTWILIRTHTSLATARTTAATASAQTRLVSDNAPATWQLMSASLNIPTSTQYMTILLATYENTINENVVGREFRGNYMDDVRFSLVPAPGPVGLAAVAGLTMLRRRR